jgi:hypothetical protein
MSNPQPATPAPADWESFYANYRKPGYVSGYEITSKLGGGVFGLVYRAQKQSIGKDYAIKFLKVDDGDVRRAIAAELEQLQYFAQIDHPNLVAIEDRGEVDGIPYLVMGFAGTETLRDHMPSEGKPPAPEQKRELLQYFLQACRGVAALHDRSLVHFDLKPANVFLKGGVARVGDYGLSKLVTQSRGSLSMGRGTPYYMAPELLQRRGDTRSDVYSLGVMLYEILCGRVPFTGDSEWEVLKQHEQGTLVVPPHVAGSERHALLGCLAKDPAARFQNVRELVAALGAPLGAGAATLHEVRNAPPLGRSASAAAPGNPAAGRAAPAPFAAGTVPPLVERPADLPPPPPLPAETSAAYAGLKRAGQDALVHAGVLARDAGQRARVVADRVARDAKAAWRDLATQAPRQVASGAKGTLRFFGFVFGTLLVLGVGGALLWVVGAPVRMETTYIDQGARGRAASPSSPRFAPTAPPAPPTQPLLVAIDVPDGLRGIVSPAPPDWRALAEAERQAAEAKLAGQRALIEATAAKAREYGARGTVSVEAPKFRVNYHLSASELAQVRRTLDDLGNGKLEVAAAAERLQRHQPDALAMAALEVAQGRADQRGIARASRLLDYLEHATGFTALAIDDHEQLSGPARAKLHAAWGQLWTWYLYEAGGGR